MRIAPGGRGLRSAEVRLEEQVCCKNEITTPGAAVADMARVSNLYSCRIRIALATPLRLYVPPCTTTVTRSFNQVRHSIQDLNDMISLLSKTEPSSTNTDFLPLIYSPATVERYDKRGTSAVEVGPSQYRVETGLTAHL